MTECAHAVQGVALRCSVDSRDRLSVVVHYGNACAYRREIG